LPRQELGTTGQEVTRLGMGCMLTSDPTVIEAALDQGITFFDTARVYQGGNNERFVGAALGSRRKDVVLCTKSKASTKGEALADLDTSLKELGTDHVDVWYLHARAKAEELSDDVLEALAVAKQQGKARFTGFSTHQGHQEVFGVALAKREAIDVILTSYNFTMEPGMEKLIADAHAAGIGIVGMKVMAGGFRRAKEGDPLHDKLSRDGALPAALRFVLKNPNVDTTIPSLTDMDQLDEDLEAARTPWSPADEKVLASHLEYIAPLYCRSCGACQDQCAQGLPVAEILRHLSYAEGYGDVRLALESYRALPANVVGRSCADCAKCTVHCPHGVRVAQRVARAQQWLA
jgi:predicted aldo/keto reductase-like oxidoreductase